MAVKKPLVNYGGEMGELQGSDSLDGGYAVAPATSTDNSIPRMDGTNSDNLQSSGVTIADNNNVSIPGDITVTKPTGTTLSQVWNGSQYVETRVDANRAQVDIEGNDGYIIAKATNADGVVFFGYDYTYGGSWDFSTKTGYYGFQHPGGTVGLLNFSALTTSNKTFSFPNTTGTVALLSNITFENLDANGDVGTGAAQVAAGNHTHSGVYEPADATILKDADIGVAVQAYSAVLSGTTASFTTADETKLGGIASGATANSSDATLLARANHTGTQTASTITVTATDRLVGRDSASGGACEEISVSGGLEWTGTGGIQRSALTGDITATAGSGTTAFRNSAALSVIGRSANSTGSPADIAASSDGDVLRRSGTTLGFGAIPQSSVTNLTTDLAPRVVRVIHGSTAGTARPSADYVEWVGSAEPTNATNNDTWIETA
jgi:hypothetical protein